jgi:hypothetical protein
VAAVAVALDEGRWMKGLGKANEIPGARLSRSRQSHP